MQSGIDEKIAEQLLSLCQGSSQAAKGVAQTGRGSREGKAPGAG